MTGVWTIEVGGIERKYNDVTFQRQLENAAPTSFSAILKYDAGNPISFFDLVEIKQDTITEWKGFIEGISIRWDKAGRYYSVSGRDLSLILWKKYGENFVNMQEDTKGFFGSVNPSELIKFLLRTPKSDSVRDYPNNKEGWGIDIGKIRNVKAYQTSYGDPQWTVLRRRGLGWRNTGNPYNSNNLLVTDVICGTGGGACDSADQWTAYGISPYLDDEDDLNYIEAQTASAPKEAQFQIDNITDSATSITSVNLVVVWKPERGFWWDYKSNCDVYLSKDAGDSWIYIATFGAKGAYWGWIPNPWRTYQWDVTDEFPSTDDLKNDNVLIKFVVNPAALKTYITQAYLAVGYITAGTQTEDEWFGLSFDKESISGIYVESRMDNDSYPENYKIITEGELEDFDDYTEVDPNDHITLDSGATPHIDWDHFTNESAWVSLYYADGLQDFDWKVAFKVTDASIIHQHMYCPFLVSIHNEDLYTQWNTDGRRFVGVELFNDGAYKLRMFKKEANGAPTVEEFPITLTLGQMYYIRIKRNAAGAYLFFYIYDNEEMSNLIAWWTTTYPSTVLYYRSHAVSWGDPADDGEAEVFSDSLENDWGAWDSHGGTAAGSFSGTPAPIPDGSWCLKVDATDVQNYYARHEDAEENVYRSGVYVYLPAVPTEPVDEDLAVNGWTFIQNDWTHSGAEPWLDDDEDVNYIYSDCDFGDTGNTDDYYTFESLDAQYKWVTLSGTYPKLHCKAKLIAGVAGPVSSANLRFYLWVNDSWKDVGVLSYTTTDYVDQSIDVSSWLTTMDKINNCRMKIELTGIGLYGPDKGGVRVTYCYLETHGFAFWGEVNLMKIFDKDIVPVALPVAGDGVLGTLKVVVDPEQGPYWRWAVEYDDSNAVTHVSIVEGIGPSSGSWQGPYWLEVGYDSGLNDGYVKLLDTDERTVIVEMTGLDTDTNGKPDSAVWCIEQLMITDLAKNYYLDLAVLKTLAHVKGEVYSITRPETVLVTVAYNTCRDIIHSWDAVEIDNLKIVITGEPALRPNRGWAISQVYIYKSEDLDYRVYVESGTPTFALNQYIQATDVSAPEDYYEHIPPPAGPEGYLAHPVGPLNIPRARLIDQINSIFGILHDAYTPYEWWIEPDATNTFNSASRRGSDKSATISFEKAKHLRGNERKDDIEDSVQRVQILGRGETKAQEIVSSRMEEDTARMAEINSFYEEVISEKTVANEEVADSLAQIYLKDNAEKSEQIIPDINYDEYAAMTYDVGDDVQIIDSLTNLDESQRIYSIRKHLVGSGTEVTLYLGRPFKDVNDEWGEIYKRLKYLEIVGTIVADWSDEGVDDEMINPNQLKNLFDKTAKNDEIVVGNDTADPKWYIDPVGPVDGRSWELSDDKIGMYGPTSGAGEVTLEVEMRSNILPEQVPDFVDPYDEDTTYRIKPFENPKMVFELKCYENIIGNNPYWWRINDQIELGFKNGVTGYGYWFKIKKVASGIFNIYAVWNEPNGSEDEKLIRSIGNNRKYRFELRIDGERQWVFFDVYDVEANAKYPISAAKVGAYNGDFILRPLWLKLTADNENDLSQRLVTLIYTINIEVERIGS